jgi:hypothetical protein
MGWLVTGCRELGRYVKLLIAGEQEKYVSKMNWQERSQMGRSKDELLLLGGANKRSGRREKQ